MPAVGFHVGDQLVSRFEPTRTVIAVIVRQIMELQQVEIQLDRIAKLAVAVLHSADI